VTKNDESGARKGNFRRRLSRRQRARPTRAPLHTAKHRKKFVRCCSRWAGRFLIKVAAAARVQPRVGCHSSCEAASARDGTGLGLAWVELLERRPRPGHACAMPGFPVSASSVRAATAWHRSELASAPPAEKGLGERRFLAWEGAVAKNYPAPSV
jgi:hypothetical protein